MQDNIYTIAYNSLENTIKIFIPYFLIKPNSKIGFNIYSTNNNFILPKVFYNNNIEIPTINDLSSEIKDISVANINDIYGIRILFNYTIPDLYISNFGLKNFVVNLKIDNKTSNKDFSDFTQLYDDFSGKLDEFTINYDNKKAIFIPYYLIGKEYSYNEFVIKQTISSKETGLQVGENKMKFHVTVPELVEANINKISLKTKNLENYDKIFIKILHGTNIIIQTKENAITKTIKWDIENKNFVVHPNDKITIIVYGVDNYGITSIIYSWILTGKEFAKKNKFSLKGRKHIKKLVIK